MLRELRQDEHEHVENEFASTSANGEPWSTSSSGLFARNMSIKATVDEGSMGLRTNLNSATESSMDAPSSRRPTSSVSSSSSASSSTADSVESLSSTKAFARMGRCPNNVDAWLSDEQIAKGIRAQRTLALISAVTLAFVCVELVGGYLAHSLAIMTDAFHMLSDLFSFIVSIFAIQMSRRKPTPKHPFGFHRAEVLGAFISILMIWMLTALLVYMAARRIVDGDLEVDTTTMLITASAGVAFNLIIGVLLFFSESKGHHHHYHHQQHDHGQCAHHRQHLHKHSHANMSSFIVKEKIPGSYLAGSPTPCQQTTVSPTRDETRSRGASSPQLVPPHRHANLNIRAAFVHAVGDLVQSVGVLAAALVIHFTGIRLADPICTFLFSVLVLLTTISVMRDVIDVFMEATPAHINPSRVYADLIVIQGVIGVHNLRIWSLKSDTTAISLHLELSPEVAAHDAPRIVARAHALLRDSHHFAFTTIQSQCQGALPIEANNNATDSI